MSLMGRTLLGLGLAAFLLGSGSAAYAQPGPEGQGRPPGHGQRHHKGGKFLESLNLTEAQKEQLKGLRELSREQRDARMREILTPEQYAKLEEMRSKRGPRGGQRWGEELGLTETQRAQMKELRNLSAEERQARLQQILTPEQLAKVQAHQEEFKQRAGERRERFAQELGLTETQKQQMKAAFEEMRSSRQGLSPKERREAMRSKLQAILTPEQFEKLETMKKERRGQKRGPRGPRNG